MHHTLPLLLLASVIGRGVDVDDDLGAGVSLHHHGSQGIPGVLADVYTNTHAVDGVNGAGVATTEVAVLVEDAVGGQVHLVVHAHQLAIVSHGGGVVDVAVGVHESDNHGQPFRRLYNAPHCLEVVLEE